MTRLPLVSSPIELRLAPWIGRLVHRRGERPVLSMVPAALVRARMASTTPALGHVSVLVRPSALAIP